MCVKGFKMTLTGSGGCIIYKEILRKSEEISGMIGGGWVGCHDENSDKVRRWVEWKALTAQELIVGRSWEESDPLPMLSYEITE